MFGYFRPFESCLTRKQTRLFNNYYCRLCYCLRYLGGQSCRALTTFDLAIYSMLLNLQTNGKEPPTLACQRFRTTNTKKFANDDIGLKLARLTFISFGEKFRDDKLDGASIKTKFFSLLYSKTIKEACAKEPVLAKISFDGNNRVNDLQNSKAPLAEIFSAYGDNMVKIFEQFAPLEDNYKKLFHALGEWTFFVDMVCDYADDYKSGAFNGFKTEGCPTFVDYFNSHYVEFMEVEERITSNLISALYAIKVEDSRWYTVFKIITQATDTVIPSLVEGKDVSFHYFKEIKKQHRRFAQENKLRAFYEGDGVK